MELQILPKEQAELLPAPEQRVSVYVQNLKTTK
jgi:hypothetical protein